MATRDSTSAWSPGCCRSRRSDDGRFALVTVGTRRIRVIDWLPDDPYPRAEVDDWPDDDGEVSSDRMAVDRGTRAERCAGLAVEMGDMTSVPEVELTGDPSFDSFRPGGDQPVRARRSVRRAVCSGCRSTRVELIDRLLDDVEAGLRFRLG